MEDKKNEALLNEEQAKFVKEQLEIENYGTVFFNPEQVGKFSNGDTLTDAVRTDVRFNPYTLRDVQHSSNVLLMTNAGTVYGEVLSADDEAAMRSVNSRASVQAYTDSIGKQKLFRVGLFEETFDLECASQEVADRKIAGYGVFDYNGIVAGTASKEPIAFDKKLNVFKVILDRAETQNVLLIGEDSSLNGLGGITTETIVDCDLRLNDFYQNSSINNEHSVSMGDND